MTVVDWLIVVLYLAILVGIGAYLNQFQDNTTDYFLGGQSMAWWQTGFSTMATQLSAVSFVSAPAFVALKQNGGLRWLAYEFAVPLALIVVMTVLIPVLHRGRYISMHQYLSDRFDERTRTVVSGLFLLMRGLSSGVIVFAGAKVLAAALPMGIPVAILLIGVVTILYDVLGGIGVVIVSDVIQMTVIFLGLLFCGYVAVDLVGWNEAWATFDPERTRILFFDNYGLNKESQYGFWPFLIGGFFLYVSYYGCDQSQVQREMSVEDEDDVRRSMLLNAFLRFPLVLVYCVVGILVGAVFISAPELVAPELGMDGDTLRRTVSDQPDFMLPYFIVGALPTGVTGLLMVAIMAALMSSLDSAMNSLSAITVRDFYREYLMSGEGEGHYLKAGRWFTFFWGAFATGSALLFHYWSEVKTVIEQINQVGNMFYGPLAAAFLLGILTRWIRARAVTWGVLLGLVVTILVWRLPLGIGLPLLESQWLFAPVDWFPVISWLWWGPIGFVVTVLVASVLSAGTPVETHNGETISMEQLYLELTDARWGWWYGLCVLWFGVIIGMCYWMEVTLG